ncbi:MAG: hypothetical protein ABW123_19300, partial [Cystobacter sp.]
MDSLGLLGPGRWAEIQRRLAIVDEVYSQDDDDAVMLRDTLLSQLRLALAETRRGDVLAFEGQQGRAYARRLNRAGVKSAERHAERLVLIAGMVGVPTSAGEGLLMVALPAGGYLIVKAGGMAFKRAVFLLRHCRNADEVVRSARSPGFKVEKVKDDSSLRGALALSHPLILGRRLPEKQAARAANQRIAPSREAVGLPASWGWPGNIH